MKKQNISILMLLGLFGLSYSHSEVGDPTKLLKNSKANDNTNPDDEKTQHPQVGISVYEFINKECAVKNGDKLTYYKSAVLATTKSPNNKPIANIFGDKIYFDNQDQKQCKHKHDSSVKENELKLVKIPDGDTCYLVQCNNKVVKLGDNEQLYTIQK